jgi:hypothetical protein
MKTETKNYRPNYNAEQLPGACIAHRGQVLADLYEDGQFIRTAVVADVGKQGAAAAQRYADERNAQLTEATPRTCHHALPGEALPQFDKPAEIRGSYRTPDGKAQIDFGLTYRNGYAEFTASGNYDRSAGQCIDSIAEAYPDDITVKTLADIWGRYHLKNIGHDVNALDVVKQFAAQYPPRSFYQDQAADFLTRNGLKFRATLSDSKPAPWEDSDKPRHHYRVTLSRADKNAEATYRGAPDGFPLSQRPPRLVFDFWGSIADAQCRDCKGKKTVKLATPEPVQIPNPKAGERFNMGSDARPIWHEYAATLESWKRETECPRCNGSGVDPEPVNPSAYDVLACISGDAHCPDAFDGFCSEYGYETDSIRALQAFRRCSAFA